MPAPLALVTGTTRGLGQAIAAALLERGWEVAGIARGQAPAALDRDGYTHVRLDLGDLVRTRAVFEDELPDRLSLAGRGRVGVVHNAAVLDIATVPQSDLQGLADTLALNVAVPVWTTGWALRRVSATAVLRVAEISSGAATSAYPGWAAYCASKAALDIATEVAAVEVDEVAALAGRDVRFLAFAPGVVATAMQEQIRAADEGSFPRRARFVAMHEAGDLVEPEAPAAVVADFLGSGAGDRFTRGRFGS